MAHDFIMARYEEMVRSKKHLPFHMGYLTEDMVVRAQEELGETEEMKAKALPELRQMLEKESKLVCPKDDAYLLQYLRARKYNVKKAFQLMQNYHQVKKSYKDIYDTSDREILKKIFDVGAIICLPYRDSEGCVIYVLQLYKWDPDAVSFLEGVVGLTLNILHCIEDEATQVCGVRIFLDVKGASFKQIRCVTPRFLTLFSRALRNCLAARFKGIHIYNESVIFQYLWSLFRVFLSEKIKKRVHFHGDNQKHLHKFIPKLILPAEYGGDYPGDSVAWYSTEVEKYFDRYAELTKYGYRD